MCAAEEKTQVLSGWLSLRSPVLGKRLGEESRVQLS
jgi:hypothetical protein